MSDLQYITGIIKSSAEITGIVGVDTFGGHDSQGYFKYDLRLNPLAGQRLRLLPSEQPDYDYIVETTGGISVRTEWVSNIQTEVFWNQVPVDTAVQVSNDNVNWKNMYFSHYDSASPDTRPYYVFVAGRTSFSTIGGTEVYEVTMLAASSLGNISSYSKYFLIYSATKTYYVWFNVGATGIDPAGAGGPITGLGYYSVPIALDTTDTAALVATKSKVVIDGLAEFLAIVSPLNNSIVTVAPSISGHVHDARPGTSGLSIVVKIQGGDRESYKYAKII